MCIRDRSNGSNGSNSNGSTTPVGQGKPGVTDYSAATPTSGTSARTIAGLPLTGTQALFLGVVALLLLTAGGVALRLRRRRLAGSEVD